MTQVKNYEKISFLGAAINIFPMIFLLSTLKVILRENGISLSYAGGISFLGLFLSFKFIFSQYINNNDFPFIGRWMHRTKTWMLFGQSLSIVALMLIYNSVLYKNVLFAITLGVLAECIYDSAFAKYQVNISAKFGSFVFFNGHKIAAVISNIFSLLVFKFFGYKAAIGFLIFVACLGFIPIVCFPSQEPFFKKKEIRNTNSKNYITILILSLVFFLCEFFVKSYSSIVNVGILSFLGSFLTTFFYNLFVLDFMQKIFFDDYNIRNISFGFLFLTVLKTGLFCNMTRWVFFAFLFFSTVLTAVFYFLNLLLEKYNVIKKISVFFYNITSKVFHFFFNLRKTPIKYNLVNNVSLLISTIFTSLIFTFLIRVSLKLFFFNFLHVENYFYIITTIFIALIILISLVLLNIKKKSIKIDTYKIKDNIDQYLLLTLFIFFFKGAKMFTHGVRDCLIVDLHGINSVILSKVVVLSSGLLGGLIGRQLKIKNLSLKTLCILGTVISFSDVLTNIGAMSKVKIYVLLAVAFEHIINGMAMSAFMEIIVRISFGGNGFLHTFLWGIFGIARSILGGVAGPISEFLSNHNLMYCTHIFTTILSFVPLIIIMFLPLKTLDKSPKKNE